jgi:hypothetical protein
VSNKNEETLQFEEIFEKANDPDEIERKRVKTTQKEVADDKDFNNL